MMDRGIDLEAVSVSFPWEQGIVLSEISCRFPPQQVSAVIGESGSGKSVLGKAILRLLDRAEIVGHIRFSGLEMTQLSDEKIRAVRGRRIFFLPQEPSLALNPTLTIGEQLTEALEYHYGMTPKEARERAEEELHAYGFTDGKEICRSYAFQLSGGMQQRILGAMASSLHPEWIIADEPTKGLDPMRRRQMLELLKKLNRDTGGGLILITHDLRFAKELAQYSIVLRQGKLVEAGAADEVLVRPQTSYAQRLVASSQIFVAGRERAALS